MIEKLNMAVGNFVRKIRCLIDDERYVPLQYARKSESDEFALKIEKALERVMQKEKFSYKEGRVLLPPIYTVLISPSDETEWQGLKQKLLESRLRHFVKFRLRSISSDCTHFSGENELYIVTADKLEKGQIEVIHRWPESRPDVEVRVRSALGALSAREKSQNGTGAQATTLVLVDDEEVTRVRSRSMPFLVEVWRHGVLQEVLFARRDEIFVGRGSPSTTVDLPLSGDPEISRLQAILEKRGDSGFKIVVKGKNPVFINEKRVDFDQATTVTESDVIKMGSYSLKLKDVV
jgi:hypothetical protein